jgi:hypothetical protein
MKNAIALIVLVISISSCKHKGESVDLIIHNARVHTMTDLNMKTDAIAIKNGKIVEVGPERQILNKYWAEEYIDASQKDVYPGFTDAHGHLLNYARLNLSVDLIGCTSYDQMLVRIEKYQGKYDRPFIIGRGWDQNLWGENELPNNERLNELFPDIPVCLFRVDGHALLANDKLIESSNVFERFKNESELNQGGYIIYDEEQKPTGVFVDNAMNPILDVMPDFPKKDIQEEIIKIQSELYAYGITGVHEAGLTHTEVKLLEELIGRGKLKLNIYVMLLPTEENISFARKKGIYTNKNLLIRSFKVYGDGALGSRGACLKEHYSDAHGHHGYLTTSESRMKEIAVLCEELGYQMNTHAIGDSANKVVLDIYSSVFQRNPDHRWRIEHAQVVDPADWSLFGKFGVFPSVQPTHATSDQRWAEKRLGENRMKGAYAYRSLLEQFGMLAIGTDFPVEYPDPFRTIYAAVERKDVEGLPGGGFLRDEAITLEDCIKGMTIWAAMASFQENELGTLEKGKDATLVIFEKPVRVMDEYEPNFAYCTFIKGKKVYSVE